LARRFVNSDKFDVASQTVPLVFSNNVKACSKTCSLNE
jgi:hypothetical protein